MTSRKGKAKGLTKSQMVTEIAAETDLTKTQVQDVFTALDKVVSEELKGGRPITVSGLIKITIQRKAATQARPGRNPSTGEAITIKAKPARDVVRVRALKALKDMI